MPASTCVYVCVRVGREASLGGISGALEQVIGDIDREMDESSEVTLSKENSSFTWGTCACSRTHTRRTLAQKASDLLLHT